jgi:hypothetical protein
MGQRVSFEELPALVRGAHIPGAPTEVRVLQEEMQQRAGTRVRCVIGGEDCIVRVILRDFPLPTPLPPTEQKEEREEQEPQTMSAYLKEVLQLQTVKPESFRLFKYLPAPIQRYRQNPPVEEVFAPKTAANVEELMRLLLTLYEAVPPYGHWIDYEDPLRAPISAPISTSSPPTHVDPRRVYT